MEVEKERQDEDIEDSEPNGVSQLERDKRHENQRSTQTILLYAGEKLVSVNNQLYNIVKQPTRAVLR